MGCARPPGEIAVLGVSLICLQRMIGRAPIAAMALLLSLLFVPAVAQETTRSFDHDETNFPLDFVHARVACDSCHVQGVFRGTPTRCHQCHTLSGRIQASAPSPNHIRTTTDCEFCHRAGVWEQVTRVDHFAVTGSCQSCHNGVIATGKNPGHIQSSDNCDDCHRTFTWLGAVFDHSGISASCISCHNGVVATPKHPQHIQTTDTCEDCHRTISWVPVVRVDHNAVFGACSTCHNGVIAEGKDADHVVTTEECDVCHSTLNWTDVTEPSPRVSGRCTSCGVGLLPVRTIRIKEPPRQ